MDPSTFMVIAVGIETPHWEALARFCPGMLTCCLDVRYALGREWGESARGSGFDGPTRDRMKAKRGWALVWAMARFVMESRGVVIILCNHGRHRSLSLAVELANRTGCELISIRSRANPRALLDVGTFVRAIEPRMDVYLASFGQLPHPIIGTRTCTVLFDGVQWGHDRDPNHRSGSYSYLSLIPGDIVIVISRSPEESQG